MRGPSGVLLACCWLVAATRLGIAGLLCQCRHPTRRLCSSATGSARPMSTSPEEPRDPCSRLVCRCMQQRLICQARVWPWGALRVKPWEIAPRALIPPYRAIDMPDCVQGGCAAVVDDALGFLETSGEETPIRRPTKANARVFCVLETFATCPRLAAACAPASALYNSARATGAHVSDHSTCLTEFSPRRPIHDSCFVQ